MIIRVAPDFVARIHDSSQNMLVSIHINSQDKKGGLYSLSIQGIKYLARFCANIGQNKYNFLLQDFTCRGRRRRLK